jgi:hypothetical protein
LKADETYNYQKLQTSFSPVTLYNYDANNLDSTTRFEKGFVGWFRNPTETWSPSDVFKVNLAPLTDTSLYLKVSLISFPLGTQLQYAIDVKNSARTIVNNYTTLRYDSLTETYNTDFATYIPLETGSVDRNNFEIKVRAMKLGTSNASQTFPSFSSFSSSSYLPYLLVVGLYEDVAGVKKPLNDNAPILSDNESCLDAPFTFSVANARNVNDDSAISSTDQSAAAAASCGTIEPPSSGGPGSSLPLMILGFFLAIMASSLIKSRKKFLS